MRYAVVVGDATGPLRVEVEVRYQPIAFRWARELRGLRRAGAAPIRLLLRIDGRAVVGRARQRRGRQPLKGSFENPGVGNTGTFTGKRKQ